MNRQRLICSIQASEGYEPWPYQDHLGWWTVGWGHKIHDMQLRDFPHQTIGEALSWLSDEQRHREWLELDIEAACHHAARFVPQEWIGLSDARQEVLVEMAFQLGGAGLQKFVKFRDAILRRHWVEAEEEMLDSLWAKQTPGRAKRLAGKFLEG